tara:strand:+ start:84 stop:302 length:219 start_codon:yes stop_codon:yes gene_type:complete
MQYLPDQVQRELRSLGKITESEAVLKEGDIFVAINVVNQSRRILTLDVGLVESLYKNQSGGSTSSAKRLLKG